MKYYEFCFPHLGKNASKKFRKPWITQTIIKMIQLRNRYNSLMHKTGDASLFDDVKRLQKHIKRSTKIAKSIYYRNLFASNSGNMQKTWSLINSLTQRKTMSGSSIRIKADGNEIDGVDLANIFNDFFIDAGKPDVTTSFEDKYMPPRVVESFDFCTITNQEVLDEVAN